MAVPVGLPGCGLHCVDAKKPGGATAGSTTCGRRDGFFGKKVAPSFPVGKQIENTPSLSAVQADWKKGVLLYTALEPGSQCQNGAPGRPGQGRDKCPK